jgi:hypothetical protein
MDLAAEAIRARHAGEVMGNQVSEFVPSCEN